MAEQKHARWTRRAFVAAAGAGLVAGTAGGWCAERAPSGTGGPPPPPPVPPDVLILVSDEHAGTLVSGAGGARTPNFDRLAREGTRLRHAYATSPICAPARQSLLTGLYPMEHGVMGNHHVLDAAVPTLAGHFRAAGYTTALIGKTHTNNSGVSHGFDRWLESSTGAFRATLQAHLGRVHALPPPEADRVLYEGIADDRLRGRPIEADHTARTAAVLELTEAFLREPHTRPWLLYVSWTEPHPPWNVPERFYNLYSPDDVVLPPAAPLGPTAAAIQARNGWDRMTEAQHRLCRARYLGAVAYSDHVLGVILGMLDRLGLADRTLVIAVSDHGDMAGDRRLWLKSVMYEPAVTVPAVIRLPGRVPAGAVCEALFSGADLFPTAAALAGVPLPAGQVTGSDLSASILHNLPGPSHVFSVFGRAVVPGHLPQLMVRNRRWKRIRYGAPRRYGVEDPGELYDVEADPGETRNLLSDPGSRRVLLELDEAGAAWVAGRRPCPWPIRSVKGRAEDIGDVWSAEDEPELPE